MGGLDDRRQTTDDNALRHFGKLSRVVLTALKLMKTLYICNTVSDNSFEHPMFQLFEISRSACFNNLRRFRFNHFAFS